MTEQSNSRPLSFVTETKFECLDCGKKVCDTPDGVCSKCKQGGEKQDVRDVIRKLNPDIPVD
jgi:hypothetical protein